MSSRSANICLFITIIFVINRVSYGKPPTQIVGGTDASIYDYPSAVSIQLHGSHICGGVFITMNHILTAAHCLAYEDQFHRLQKYGVNSITVSSGSNSSVIKVTTHNVAQLFIHPRYQGTVDWHGNDIGIIKLAETVPEDATHQAAKLPSMYCQEHSRATVIGWGYLYAFSMRTSEKLKKASVSTLSNNSCQKMCPFQLGSNHLCALHGKGVGFCDGDSGGPLFVNGEVAGIVSMGYDCGSGLPDIYTRVHAYLPWIISIVTIY